VTAPALRWALSPYDAHCHALDPEQANRAAERGWAQARCWHTMPAAGLAFTEMPCGVLCL
jgi:hypothetical protein